MKRLFENVRKAIQRVVQAALRNDGHAARTRQMHEFLTHPEQGTFRREYVRFFAGQVRPDTAIHVDFKDERRFTERLKRRYGGQEGRIDAALQSMSPLFFEKFPERYTLYTRHIEAVRHAERIRMQLEKAQKGN